MEQQQPNGGQYSYDYRVAMPSNELHFTMMTTESAWGSPDMNPVVQEELQDISYLADEKGNLIRDDEGKPIPADIKRGWDIFSMYTRDMRLSNLDGDELNYVDAHLDIAFHLLQNKFPSGKIALGYAATMLETRQSKKGFLRRRMNTLTTENINRELEPPKKRLFSKGGGE